MPDTQTFTANEYIPMAAWSKDHWSTLAYIETVMVECGGFQVGSDARMRSNRRNFRVMGQCPKPSRPNGRATLAMTMRPEHGTRLANGQVLENHDDWACLQDLANEWLFTCVANDIEPGAIVHLSERGRALCDALRAHKASGGTFGAFVPPVLPSNEPTVSGPVTA